MASAVALTLGASAVLTFTATQATAATVTSTEAITIPGYVDGQRGSVQIAPNGSFAYASYLTKSALYGSPTWKLARIDLSSNSVVSSILTSFEVTSVAFTDDSAFAYVAGVDGSNNKIAKYRTSDGEQLAVSAGFGSTGGAATVALDVISNEVQPYVATASGGLYRITGDSLVATKITQTSAGAISDNMAGFVISRDTHLGYVAGQSVSKIFTLNTLTNEFTAALSTVTAYPWSLAISGNGQRLLVSHATTTVVSDIDLSGIPTRTSFSMSSTTRAGDAGIAISSSGTELYVPSTPNDVLSAVDLSASPQTTQELVNPTSDQPLGIALSSNGGIILVAHVKDPDDYDPAVTALSTSSITRVNLYVEPSASPSPTPTGESSPAPAPAPTAEPIVVPTVAPVVIPTTAPTAAPVELPAGSGGALINGVSTPVTVSAAVGGNAVVVSAGGVSVEVGGTGADGKPLPLAPDGSLIVAQSGGVSMGGAGFSPNSSVSLFMYSTPTKLGELPVSATGSYSGSALIPAGIEAGSHTIQAVGYTPSGETLALSVGVTVKSAAAIRGAKPVVRASAGTKTAGAKFVATASGVQSRCTVRFWTKGSTQTVNAGVAGNATAVLKAPSSAGTWAVTATVSGNGCEPKVTKSMIRVSSSAERG